ncbi:hypothetical protein FRC04_003369 [Tulasnella sp. 424]|nr:hypothetical protein FRC04_003369 [Tulasnella sp. 424]KAG8977184.1 hypothetical protein FRC05_002183 [Tulasnella sp. 425]
MSEFDLAVERCTADIMEFFAKLNRLGTEQTTFEETPAMIDTFNDFRGAIENSVRRKTAAWLRPRNSLAPIHKLPVELIQHIFHLTLFASSGRRHRQYVAKLNVLRSVAWMWRDLIDRTPSFWTQLSSRDHIDFVSDALEKSQNYNLQLKYAGNCEDGGSSPFLEKAFVHLHRWEHVVIREPHGRLIESYLMSPAPRLKRFTFSTQLLLLVGDYPPSGIFFGGELGGLEEFRVVGLGNMDWTDFPCRRLKTLEIEGCSILDMETFFGILAENPELGILRIHSVTFHDHIHPSREPESLVLPRLTNFTFTNNTEMLGEEGMQTNDTPFLRLLQRVQIPACTSFWVEIGSLNTINTPSDEFFQVIPRPIDVFTRGGSGQTSKSNRPIVRMILHASQFECQAFGTPKSGFKYRVLLRSVPTDVGAEWARREFVDAWAETSEPEIHLQCFADEEGNTLDVMSDFANVVQLDAIGNFAPEQLAQRLETPVTSESGTLIGPFLGLRNLRLDYCYITGTDVLRMVKERFLRITNALRPGEPGAKGGTASVSLEEGITIIWGADMDRISRSIAREIRAAPGVKDLWLDPDSSLEDDGSSSCSSEESDWSPHFVISDDGPDTSSEDGVDHDEIGEWELQ